jgi:thiol:disulfide interchange protein
MAFMVLLADLACVSAATAPQHSCRSGWLTTVLVSLLLLVMGLAILLRDDFGVRGWWLASVIFIVPEASFILWRVLSPRWSAYRYWHICIRRLVAWQRADDERETLLRLLDDGGAKHAVAE